MQRIEMLVASLDGPREGSMRQFDGIPTEKNETLITGHLIIYW